MTTPAAWQRTVSIARKEILHNTTPVKGALRMGDWKLVVNGNVADPADEEDAQPKAKKKKEPTP